MTLPVIVKATLPNGLRVWTVRHTGVPLVSFVLLLQTGSAKDPVGKEGLAAITADMLDEGSAGRSALEIHEALAQIGAQFDTDIASDAVVVGVTCLSHFDDRALRLLADIVVRPALADADFDRVRQLRLHRLRQLRDMPGAVADRAFLRRLYGSQPYGHAPIGSEQTVATLCVDDVRAFHERMFRPADTTLVVVGDCQPERVEKLANDAFAGWAREAGQSASNGSADRPTDRDEDVSARRLYVVPRLRAPQSELRIGHVAAARSTPDYHALITTNMILGGQFVSRINLNLREDKGFTYGARTSFDFRRMPGPFALQVSVQTAATARAIEESIGEISAIRGSRPATPDELALAVAALTKGYARFFETAGQIAHGLTQLALHNLPDDELARLVPCVEQVAAADVTRVAAQYLDPARLIVLAVGDLDVIGPDLPALGLGDPVVLPANPF